MQQNQVVRIQTFFNRKTKKGWNTEYSNDVYLFSPDWETVKAHLQSEWNAVSHLNSYHMKGELDRRVQCKAFYPEVHKDCSMAYWGVDVAQIIDGELKIAENV